MVASPAKSPERRAMQGAAAARRQPAAAAGRARLQQQLAAKGCPLIAAEWTCSAQLEACVRHITLSKRTGGVF